MVQKRWLLMSASIAVMAGQVVPVYSQTEAGASQEADGTRLVEIVVTANKREQDLNQVGLTVTALSGELLKERQITSLSDIADAVPGLSFAQSVTNTPILSLRGVGFNNGSLGVYPAVSVYSDQAPLPFPVMASHSSYDLQRVEVLKGPQGTLFGENSTGGAINEVPQQPTDKPETGGDITYGNFNQVSGDAYASGPLSDSLKARVAVTGLRADGWQISDTRPDDRNGSQGYFAGRIIVDWSASDLLHMSLNANAWTDHSQPQAGQLIALVPQTPTTVQPQAAVYPLSSQSARSADWTPSDPPRGSRDFFQTALRTDAKLSNDITLTSLTTFDSFDQHLNTDNDGSSLILTDRPDDHGHISSFNQELRLSGSANSSARWLVGGNVEHSTTFESQLLRYPDESNSNAAHNFIFQNFDVNGQRILNYAFFGNLEYDVSSKVTLKGGVRYTDSKDDGTSCTADVGDGHLAALFNELGSVLNTVPFSPVGTTGPEYGRCVSLNQNLVPSLTPFQSTLSESNVSWRVGADYRIDDNTLAYVNVSRGYKAGSFPTEVALTEAEYQPVTEESVTAYEAGLKQSSLDRRIHVNLAGFYYDYKDKQVDGSVQSILFGPLDTLVNVPKSRVYGFDGDLSAIVFSGLTIAAALTYLDSKIEDYTGTNPFGDVDNFAGQKLPFAPRWSYSLNADYRRSVANEGTAFVGVSVLGRTAQDTTIGGGSIDVPVSPVDRAVPGLLHPFETNSYATVDLRGGYESPNGRWKLTFWGKNIFDKYYWNNVITAGDANVRFAAFPATYGITFAIKYQ